MTEGVVFTDPRSRKAEERRPQTSVELGLSQHLRDIAERVLQGSVLLKAVMRETSPDEARIKLGEIIKLYLINVELTLTWLITKIQHPYFKIWNFKRLKKKKKVKDFKWVED